jgi:hypothetical protein
MLCDPFVTLGVNVVNIAKSVSRSPVFGINCSSSETFAAMFADPRLDETHLIRSTKKGECEMSLSVAWIWAACAVVYPVFIVGIGAYRDWARAKVPARRVEINAHLDSTISGAR